MILFDIREKDKDMDNNDPQIIKASEQIIFSIVTNQITEKVNYFIDKKTNNFNYELFVYILMEQIKSNISLIFKNSKMIDNGFFREINKNIVKKKQSIITNFLVAFHDGIKTEQINIEQINLTMDKEDNFIVSCIKIILVLDKYIEKNKISGIFGQFKTKENKKIINKLILYLIRVLNIFIHIKKNKEAFNIKENLYYNSFDILIQKTYENNVPSFIILLYDIIFKYDLITFFQIILKNDDISTIITNKLGYDHQIRYKFLELLNNSPSCLGEKEQKDLLKILDSNNTIMKLFHYITNDIENKIYNNENENFSILFRELKNLYFFSILINSKNKNIENIIINIFKKIIKLIKKDKLEQLFGIFVNELFKLGKKIPKHKYKIYNFMFLISESINNIKIMILKHFFTYIKGNLNLYFEISKNMNSFNLFLNNLYDSKEEIISIYFEFLKSLKEKGYLPLNEIIHLLEEIPLFKDISLAQTFIKNLEIFIESNEEKYLNNDIDLLLKNDNKELTEEKEDNNNNVEVFRKKIYESYLNILFNIINEIKDNINSKSPFEIDVTLSSIIKINYSNEVINKKCLSTDILILFVDFLSVVLKNEKIFQLFIAKKFLEFFPYLINDDEYRIIPYKLIKIFSESKVNNEKFKDKNNEQILNILNRFNSLLNNNNKNDEIKKLKEILLILNSIKIFFSKKSIISLNDMDKKLNDFYIIYPQYFSEDYKKCSNYYNKEYHSLLINYLDIIIELIIISNKNVIIKNNNYFPFTYENIKIIINNLIKFYVLFTEENKSRNIYFLNIIKYFIDQSLNLYLISEKNNNLNIENNLSEEDFTLYYIKKYNINSEIYKENNETINKNIISNFNIQSPLIILLLLKSLVKYKKYTKQFLEFIYFLCKINQQNIIYLLKHNILKILFKFFEEKSFYDEIVFKILKESFKYLDKNDFCFIFDKIINLLNNSEENKANRNIIIELLQSIINTLQILNDSNNSYCSGIILSENKIEQTNVYNLMEIKNIKFFVENKSDNKNNIIIIKQEIYFYESLETKKLLLLRITNFNKNNNEELDIEEKTKNEYLEISFRNKEIIVTEDKGKMKYDDLSNYNSIFIDDIYDLKLEQENLKLNENNMITYLIKKDKKTLVMYINGIKKFSYEYKFKFEDIINIEIGYPLDLIQENNNNNFILYNHIKLKSFAIYLYNKDNIEKIYKLNYENIKCNNLFPDELHNFKLDENTYLTSKYNNINSITLNSIFKYDGVKSQFYKKVFFNQIYSSYSLNYLFRLEKYIFILLNNSNIDKTIFNQLIQLLSIYLIMNKPFINKFFAKEEFLSLLYFSLYRNAKFIDINSIEYLLSIIFLNNTQKNTLIIDILLDTKIFELMNSQVKIDLLKIINNNIIEKEKNIINNFYIFEKLQKILLLCSFNNIIVDELIINIIFKALEENPKEKKLINLVEELIYILFHFSKFNLAHLTKFKNGKNEETSKILYKYFHKIYNNENTIHLKDYILEKFQDIFIDEETNDKINRLIKSYSPYIIDEFIKIKNENKIFNLKDDEDENLFDLSKDMNKIKRSNSFSYNKKKNNLKEYNLSKNSIINIQEDNTKKFDKKMTMSIDNINNMLKFKKGNKTLLNNFPNKFESIREPSIRPLDDVIIFKGVINGSKRKTLKNIFKTKVVKKNSDIDIIITEKEKEKCNGDCHLCHFIKQLLLIMFKREKKYNIYKNNLMHYISNIFILNQNKNKNLDFKLKFSYYLIKREGPNRIRNRFNIRIDKLLNNEYDHSGSKNKNEENKEYWNLFDFYENKANGKYISDNLLNFFNLDQIFNINIIKELVEEDDKYQECFNCLLFKGFSYLNSILILGTNKIYIISRVLLSKDNIIYDAQYPISKKFWILNHYEDILSEKCEYLNSYENINNLNKADKENIQRKKKSFEKIEKGFWIYSFQYIEINEIHKRRYIHQNNAIEIFLKNGKNYYLALNINKRDKLIKLIINNIKLSHKSINNYFTINKEQEKENQKENIDNIIYEMQNESLIKTDNMIFIKDSNIFLESSKKHKRNNYIEYIFKKQKKSKHYLGTIIEEKSILEKSYEKWTFGHISTYSYLMILNTLSCRTYNDLAQYPIYPWILSNCSSNEIDFNNPNNYRDFNYPIYAQDKDVRDNLAFKYENLEDYKCHSGSHYSNSGFVCYFLIRIKPFSITNAEIQGLYFDTPDRLFFDIVNLSKMKEKYQELIPDLFNIPEIFININKFKFRTNSEKKYIDNVIIPSWGNHSPRIYCKILKKSLESKIVSLNINNWIDLIFGYKQKGKQAEKYYNVLREVCSRFNPDNFEDENEIEMKINEICEMGINPKQLFIKPHHKREKHQKIKAFFCKNIYLHYFKQSKEIFHLKNFENNDNDNIKEMRQYYEYPYKYISKGEGGLSSFRICYEEDDDKNNNEDNKNNDNLIYFIINGKKTLIPPSYKNFIKWDNNNCFYIVKPYKNIKYKFYIQHMMKYIINCIKITKDGNYLIIGYNNGIIEKYKLNRIWGPKSNQEKEKNNEDEIILNEKFKENNDDNDIKKKDTLDEVNDNNNKEGLFNILFKNNNNRRKPNKQFYKNININNKEDEEENINILKNFDNLIHKRMINNSTTSNKILFDTHLLISTSNIINSDCIILNNNSGKFIQYSGHPLNNKEEIEQIDIQGYEMFCHNNNNTKNIISQKENINNNSLEKNYIIYLVNSFNHIFEEITMIEICETFSFILIIDKENYLYILDFISLDLIKKIDCNIYFNEKIRFISICPITGDFILSTNYQIILMNINGVFITKKSNFKSKIKYCFITSISNSDLYLFTAHENGNIMISQLINNLNGIIFDVNKFENNLLNSIVISDLNNKYNPIKIKNISQVYYNAYDTSNDKYNINKEFKNYIKDENNFSLIFDTLTEINCSEYSLKFIKLTQNASNLICIDIKNNIINLNYEDFFVSKKKYKDRKSIIYCYKCKNQISSNKFLCQICGKKLCPNCKEEIIIPEISLKHNKPVCDECFQLINKSNQNLYDF